MSLIPFPVCEYTAIHYKDGRRLEKLARASALQPVAVQAVDWQRR